MEDNQCPETCKPVPSACEENPEGLLGYNSVDGNYLKEKPPPWENSDHDCPADSEAVPGSCSTVKVELAEGSDGEICEDCSRQVECKFSTNTNAELNEVEQSFTTLPVHPSQSLSCGGDSHDSGSSIPPVFENYGITGASVITLEEIGMPSVDSNGPGIQFNQSEIKDSKAGAIPKRKKKKKMLCDITETVLPLDPDATAYFSIDPNLQVPGDFQASLSSVVAQAATGRSDKSGDILPSMEPTGSKCENSSEYIPKSCSQKVAEELSKSGNLDACVPQGQVTKTKKRKKKKAAKASVISELHVGTCKQMYSSIVPLTDPSTSFTGFAEIQNSSSQNSYLTQAAKDLTEAMKYLTVSIDQRPDSELKGAVRDLTKAVKGLTNNMEELLSQRNTTSFVISSNLQENISVQEEHSPEVYASNIPDLPEHLAEKQALSNIPDLPEHLAEKQALSNIPDLPEHLAEKQALSTCNIPDLPSSVESGTQNVNLAEVKRIIKKKKKYGKTAPLPFSSLVDYPFDLEADFKLIDQIFTENIENETMSLQDTDNTLRESVPTMSKKKKKPKKKSQKQNVDSGASGMEGVQATLLKTSDFASGGLVRSSEGTCSTTKHLEEEPPLKADFSSKAMNANTCLGEASSGSAPPNINPSTCMSLPAGSDSQNNSVKLKGCSTKVKNQQRITVILTKGQKRRQKQALKKQLPKKDKTTGASLDTASKNDEHGKKVFTKTAPKSKPLVVQSTSSEAGIAVGDGETRKKKLQKRKKRVEVGLQQQDRDLGNSAPSCGLDESPAVERPNMYTLLKMGLLQPGGKMKKVIPKDQGSDSSDSVLPGDSLSEMYGSPDSSGGGRYGSSEGPPAKGRQRKKKRSNQHQILQSPADGANAMRVKPGSAEGRPDFLPHGQGRSGSPRLHSPNTQHTNRNWANDGAGQYSRRRNESPGQPGRRDVQVGDGQNSRAEGKRGGGAGRQNQEKKPVFNKHWTMDMVSQGLKKGFLVEGAIRVNPKNYEDAYIPCPDGLSDIYISGFSNRNRALNGDIVAVLVNDPSDWKVHMDSFEQYEANLLKQMEDLKVTENEGEKESVKGDQDVIIESEETTAVIVEDDPISNCSSQDSKSNCVLGKPAVSQSDVPDETVNTVNQSECTAGKSHSVSQSGTFLQSIVDCATSGSSRSQQNVTDATMVIDSPQKNKENRTPRKDNSESKTPGSMNRNYTSVKDVLTQNGCSPVAQRLFSREDSKASTSTHEDSMSQKFLQKTGKVLAIIEKKHSRACSGHIKPMKDRNKRHALFCPTDHRCPRIMVPMSDCPADFLERPDDHSNTLFIARITDWPDTSQFAHGNLARSLGEAGLIEPETEAMLIECDIDYSEFSPEALESLPKESPWVIPPDELSRRKDFRGHCIFTIDPATARDLDDALSCEDLGNGLYEVGVHIADVSYFLQENTALDTVASKRATSVYLVQKVVPMLPRLLCEQLCSLNPYHDRLTFSVIWHMNQDGEIQGEWFGRSVIRSCVKLSYDHAQGFIDHPDKEFSDEELPPISNGFSVAKIREKVLNLHKIAQKLRKNRFDNGALRLDQIKLQFSLDKDTGLPNGYSVYKQRESNKLVEEFMLLANMAVAHKILRTYPEIALLRRHPPPQSKMIDDLCDLCESLSVPVDTSSAGALQRSLDEYVGEDDFSIARLQVLVSLCSKPMQNARYFCTGITDDEELFHHYALNVPVYTHFTSPIRRYPDVIVHRLLGAALGYCDPPDKAKEAVQRQAEHCNDKKLASKTVQERSSDVFFSVFVKEVGPLEEAAMVMGVLNRSFDVFVLRLGVTKRVYCEKLPVDSFDFRKDKKRPSLTLVWPATETNPAQVTQEITIFTMVKAILKADGGPLRWSASILHPGLKEK